MIFPLVRELAAEGIPVAVTCRVLGFSRQGCYAWLAAPVSDRDLDEAYLINAAIDIHTRDREFGYRFVADELAADAIRSPNAGYGGCVHRLGCFRCIAADAASIVGPGRRSTMI